MEQIAIYMRLSKEDDFMADESNSISNQRKFIRSFINKDSDLRKIKSDAYKSMYADLMAKALSSSNKPADAKALLEEIEKITQTVSR